MAKTTFSRRNLLRGIGAGAALLAPFVRTQICAAQAAQKGNFLVFFTPNGFVRSRFGADGSGSNFTFLPSLSPLEAFKAEVAVIKGLCNKSTSDKASHEEITRILTCRSGSDMYRAYGPSIDHVIARHIGQRPLTLAVERFRDDPNWQTKLSWVDSGANDPHVKDPKRVFELAFSGVMAGATPADPGTVDQVFAQNKSVLDFVREDIARFKTRLGALDRAKLDLHLDALREVELRVATAPSAPPPPSVTCDPNAVRARSQEALASDQVAGLRQYGEIMTDLIATAFACGSRRVATLQWQPASGGINPNAGGGDHHQVSHYEAPNSGDQWPRIDRWYAERFSYTLTALDQRGVLGDTIVVWATEISQEHNQNNFVMLAAGGRNLGFKLGQSIQYAFHGSEGGGRNTARDSRNRSQADLWVSCQKAFGIRSDTFGDPEYSSGGLQELFAG
jgi:hypothetical protein